jgi:hypothetical protein
MENLIVVVLVLGSVLIGLVIGARLKKRRKG